MNQFKESVQSLLSKTSKQESKHVNNCEKPACKQCNYENNYYQDQVCK